MTDEVIGKSREQSSDGSAIRKIYKGIENFSFTAHRKGVEWESLGRRTEGRARMAQDEGTAL
jgi:hypothetical protein